MVEANDPKSVLEGLDPDQRTAAEALMGSVCILAGAGTGKTRAVTHRIAYGVRTGWVPERTLAVTFTARAAAEMRERLEQMGVHGVQVYTFHAMALRQMMYFWPKVTEKATPKLIENKKALIREIARDFEVDLGPEEISYIETEIGWSKVSLIAPDEYEDEARALDRDIPSALNFSLIGRIIESYDSTKAERGLVDFEDVLLVMIHMMRNNQRVADDVRNALDHIMVDEFQDVSPLQWEMLQCWLGNSVELCVVGDPSQTIYSFTGATPKYLLRFTEKYPNARIVQLVRDYRSSPQIVEVANKVLQNRGKAGFEPLELVSQAKNEKKPVRFKVFPDDDTQSAVIAREIKAIIDSGKRKPSDIAILFRINSQAKDFVNALNKQGIQCFVKLTNDNNAEEKSDAQKEAEQNAVTLVSMHSSKGLEWDTVYLVGICEGLVPFIRSRTPESIEEERRLFYVAITRAKRELFISYAKTKNIGTGKERLRSRFLDGVWVSQ